MDLLAQSSNVVEKWRNVYATASQNKDKTSYEVKILKMIEQFDLFRKEYVSEVSRLSSSEELTDKQKMDINNALAAYWAPILCALEQHDDPKYRTWLQNGYKKLNELQHNFEKILGLTLDVPIVLYIEGVGKAKRFPFGGIYLIGVAESDAKKNDWMAVPHELGHHIFWKTKFSENDTGLLVKNFLDAEINTALGELERVLVGEKRSIKKINRLKESVKETLNNWAEEIFADVVGTRVARSDFLLASHDRVLQMASATEDLFTSDGEHPIPFLIPYIRSFALDSATAPVPWAKYGGFNDKKYESLFLEDDTDKKNPLSRSILRDTVIRTFVNKIVEKLTSKKLVMDKLIAGTFPMEELKKFITETTQIPSEKELLEALLNPIILEKNEMWYCSTGHKNSSRQNKCLVCRERRRGSFFLFRIR